MYNWLTCGINLYVNVRLDPAVSVTQHIWHSETINAETPASRVAQDTSSDNYQVTKLL